MAAVVGGLLTPLLQREELIAEINERCCLALAAQLEIEQATVERQSRIDVADLESDVIETDGTRFSWLRHAASPGLRCPPGAHPDWIVSGCARDSWVLRISLSEHRFTFADMR